eukprot:Plantae.Rhodophyta-Hildenbrandia_rubra.ctg76952.p1 GENE.Plantae.Rhodophyta-Hildenbrandia_rubra.ctg76952~~Plantae.Rhodophyta-Hildenbrandia_rubra.ctg76952.p1  ORF type:complete len:197 (+),score=9.18 Plantae.Rhodophyta-Hildenbrandia_rubra.ctg76952:427-1017(+)
MPHSSSNSQAGTLDVPAYDAITRCAYFGCHRKQEIPRPRAFSLPPNTAFFTNKPLRSDTPEPPPSPSPPRFFPLPLDDSSSPKMSAAYLPLTCFNNPSLPRCSCFTGSTLPINSVHQARDHLLPPPSSSQSYPCSHHRAKVWFLSREYRFFAQDLFLRVESGSHFVQLVLPLVLLVGFRALFDGFPSPSSHPSQSN